MADSVEWRVTVNGLPDPLAIAPFTCDSESVAREFVEIVRRHSGPGVIVDVRRRVVGQWIEPEPWPGWKAEPGPAAEFTDEEWATLRTLGFSPSEWGRLDFTVKAAYVSHWRESL